MSGNNYFNKDPKTGTKEIFLPEGLEIIGDNAFEEFGALESISIPASVKEIGKDAFYRSGIKSVELREGLRIIGKRAFCNTALSTVVIPESVKKIEAEAFYGCNQLRDFYISSKTQQLIGDILVKNNRYETSKIYVHTPSGSPAEEYMKKYNGVYVVNDYPAGG